MVSSLRSNCPYNLESRQKSIGSGVIHLVRDNSVGKNDLTSSEIAVN